LPAGAADDPRLTVVEADVTTLPGDELRRLLEGCGAVVSCLGHTVSLRGVYGPPRDLVARTVERLCRHGDHAATRRAPSPRPHELGLGATARREPTHAAGAGERAFAWLLRALLPPARDNQRAADVLALEVGADAPFVEWVVVRPDSLVDGEVSAYRTHDGHRQQPLPGRRDPLRQRGALHGHARDGRCRVADAGGGRMPVVVDAQGREGRGGPLSERGAGGG
jgi:hypothetical protein